MSSITKAIDLYTIDHMTHERNLDSIFRHGLLAHGNPFKKVDISNREVNGRRARREPVYGRKIHDYVPFYFNPRNAMMYRNQDEDIVVLGFDPELIHTDGVLFTDRNAATDLAEFYNDPSKLLEFDWKVVFSDSWYGWPESVKQKMMSEVLVHERVGMEWLRVIYCKDEQSASRIRSSYGARLRGVKVVVDPEMFFMRRAAA
jgi:hypothetical protein